MTNSNGQPPPAFGANGSSPGRAHDVPAQPPNGNFDETEYTPRPADFESVKPQQETDADD